MTLLLLYIEFFRIGLFAMGGGLATIPFLQELTLRYDWLTSEKLLDLIAIAEATPGPIGVNAATYAGYYAEGIIGGIIAVMGLITPSIIIVILIAHFFKKFKDEKIVKDSFWGIRPVVAGLIGAAGISVAKVALFTESQINVKAWAFLFIFLVVMRKWEMHPILMIVIGGVIGVLFKM